MPLTDTYPRGVLFVGRRIAPGISGAIEGTGFLVAMYGAVVRDVQQFHLYVVTAAHVIKGVPLSFVRVPLVSEGEVKDVDVPEWYVHPEFDVAVAPIDLPGEHYMVATDIDQFVDSPTLGDQWFPSGIDLNLGETVYFVGLLGKIDAMTEGNIPIVRSGTLGRLWQERCPVETREGTEYITAHLIDCRSFSGFSGSPCYVQWAKAGVVGAPDAPAITTKYRTALLGLIGGHYDDWGKVKHRYGDSDLEAQANTGVGYVIPAEHIRATLDMEELIAMRREVDENRPREEGATQDSVVRDESEYDRFEDLTKKIVQVPKSELSAEHAERDAQRED